MKDFESIINKITQNWFLSEPLLFSVFCSHEMVENKNLHVPFRTGKCRVEYNPEILETLDEHFISEYLKIEMFRILLFHPYQRQPTGAKKAFLTMASDAVIYSTYQTDVKLEGIKIIDEMIHRLKFMKDGFPNRQNHMTVSDEENSLQKEYSNGPMKIHKSAVDSYFDNNNAESVKPTENGYTCLIENTVHVLDLTEDGEWYTVMRFNKVLGNYEYIKGGTAKNFWNSKVKVNEKGLLEFPKDLCFEEWYQRIYTLMNLTDEEGEEKVEDGNQSGQDGHDNGRDKRYNTDKLHELSENWEEDDQTQQKVKNLIEDADNSEQWGSISGDLKTLIQANKTVNMNYTEILRHFSTSVISSKRNLSRMKPNRRFGFERMGSRFNLNSNLLVAVDVSSSITKENLEYIFSIINQFFRYGVDKIDVIQFDEKIVGNPTEMKKAMEYIQITGRGGTDFQPAADFYDRNKQYDGMIYFTDGFGPHPKFKRYKVDVLWIFTTKTYYEKGKKWADEIPGNISTFIPLP